MAVYNACVISTLLYGSESWTTYARHERRLNTFHLRCMRRILGISWQDKYPTLKSCLGRTSLACTHAKTAHVALTWARTRGDERIPKDILYEELGIEVEGHPSPLI